jgi:hypothetical protein
MSVFRLFIRGRGNEGPRHRRNKTITAPRDGFHEAWVVRGVAENFSQSHYCIVQPVVKIYESVPLPETIAQLISGDNFALILKEYDQDLKRLLWKLETKTLFAKLAGLQVHLENSEM